VEAFFFLLRFSRPPPPPWLPFPSTAFSLLHYFTGKQDSALHPFLTQPFFWLFPPRSTLLSTRPFDHREHSQCRELLFLVFPFSPPFCPRGPDDLLTVIKPHPSLDYSLAVFLAFLFLTPLVSVVAFSFSLIFLSTFRFLQRRFRLLLFLAKWPPLNHVRSPSLSVLFRFISIFRVLQSPPQSDLNRGQSSPLPVENRMSFPGLYVSNRLSIPPRRGFLLPSVFVNLRFSRDFKRYGC